MDNKIKLQVGEQQFITTIDTLVGESAYFSALFSGRWNTQGDGECFIDSDPALFAEVLRYLRSGNFPLFFDPGTRTCDYAKYAALLGEARYFGIAKLEDWIQKQKYLDAVKVRYLIDVVETEASDDILIPLHGYSTTVGADERLDFSITQRTQSIYKCPRGIPVHEGQPEKCGRQCDRARGEREPEYEKTQLITAFIIKTKQIFNPEVCSGGHGDQEEND